ncbi:MAG: hypothetical protein NTZ15_00265 [Burkholderiales bacterium]|jgi:hypothetical protein|nr:hypothetical protein [Burkholderiales bacterium]
MRTANARPTLSSYIYFGAAILMAVTAATAQVSMDASGDYQQEVLACNNGKTQQDKATCLTEARSAHAVPKQSLSTAAQADLQANALQRCDALNGADKAACRARIEGQGTASGSVAGGGILREMHEVEIMAPASPTGKP